MHTSKKRNSPPYPPVVDPLTGLVPLLTIKQVAHYLNKSVRTIRQYIQDRKLDCFKLDGDLRFRLDDVERYLQKRRLRAD